MELRHIKNGLQEINVEDRTAEFVISDNTKDRHNTVLDVEGWDLTNYSKNGIVGYQHDVYGAGLPNPDSVIGIGKAEIRDGKLIGTVKFETEDINPLAEKIFKKVQFGTLKATSVGFSPLEEGEFRAVEGSEDEVYHYGKRDLLEWSIVNIPSNPMAVRQMEQVEKNGLTFEKSEPAPEPENNSLALKQKVLELLEKELNE